MSVSASPEVQQSPHEPGREAWVLIEEARQRARRRRRRRVTGLFVGVAVLAGGALAVGRSATGDGQAAPAAPDRDADRVAVGEPPTRTETLVASWGQIHRGWVKVYDTGRVLLFLDIEASRVPLEHYRIYEGHLTPAGVDRVKAGEIQPGAFLGGVAGDATPPELGATAEMVLYAPPAYALCRYGDAGRESAAAYSHELAPTARAVLSGTEHAYAASTPDPAMHPFIPQGPLACFTMTPRTAAALLGLDPSRGSETLTEPEDLDRLVLGDAGSSAWMITPVLPDGSLVLWGG